MEKKIYVSSYYQLDQYTCSHFTQETQRVLAFVLNRHGEINVSYTNLDAVTHLCNQQLYRTPESDYLTALASDLEVAIQERKIQIMAARLGFEFILEPSSCPRPSLIYSPTDDESLVEDLELRAEDTVCGSIYVVNTHGHPLSIDGPYEQAINNSFSLKRIVIDACSSATLLKSKDKSMLDLVAERAFYKNREHDLEIVGYARDFLVKETQLTSQAIFAKKDLLLSHEVIKLITPENHKIKLAKKIAEIIIKHQAQYEAEIDSKDMDIRKKLQVSQKYLKNVLFELCSKLTNILLTTELLAPADNAKIIKVLIETMGEKKEGIPVLEQQIILANKPINKKELKNQFKEKRRFYIDSLNHTELLTLCGNVYHAINNIHQLDIDFEYSKHRLGSQINNSLPFEKLDISFIEDDECLIKSPRNSELRIITDLDNELDGSTLENQSSSVSARASRPIFSDNSSRYLLTLFQRASLQKPPPSFFSSHDLNNDSVIRYNSKCGI